MSGFPYARKLWAIVQRHTDNAFVQETGSYLLELKFLFMWRGDFTKKWVLGSGNLEHK